MKKTILFVAGLLTFAILATACTGPAVDTPANEQLDETTEQLVTPDDGGEGFVPKTAQEQLDVDTLVKAVQTRNEDLCKTIENEIQKDDCLVRVNDQLLLEKAQEEIDKSLCGEITRASVEEQCETLVEVVIEKENERIELEKFYEDINTQIEEDGEALKKATGGGKPTVEDCGVIKNVEFKEGCLALAEAESAE